jgi:hypothetical protein
MSSSSKTPKVVEDLINFYDFDHEYINQVYHGTMLNTQVHNKKTKDKFMRIYEKKQNNKTKYEDRCIDLKTRLRQKFLEKNDKL